jgi:hypothetical protein
MQCKVMMQFKQHQEMEQILKEQPKLKNKQTKVQVNLEKCFKV